MKSAIGSRIRKLRKQQNRTLQDISDVCEFTRSLLCKIETGKTVPPIATLEKIASALGVQVADLLSEKEDVDTVFTPAAKTLSDSMTSTDKGYSFLAFAAKKHNKLMQPYLFVAKKGEVKAKSLSHPGEEFIYVLEGEMKYRVGTVEYSMSPGDSLYFDSLEEHDLQPLTDTVVYLAVFSEKQ